MTEMLVLPFYVVMDVSYSMTMGHSSDGAHETPIQSGNNVIKEVKVALEDSPLLSDKVRFSLIDFSDDAQVVIPMCDLTTVAPQDIPTLTARGGTSYAAAFRLMQRQIRQDVAQLKADGHKVHRPAVFFLTDGDPTDSDSEWQATFADLTSPSFKERPNFIPFGVGQAKKAILDQLVYPQGKMRSFIQQNPDEAANGIRAMAEILIGSIVGSATSFSEGSESGAFVLPEPDEDESVWL
mgnify:CR=1 FL=1